MKAIIMAAGVGRRLHKLNMNKPKCAQKKPYVLKGEKKKYAWCACGESTKASNFIDNSFAFLFEKFLYLLIFFK